MNCSLLNKSIFRREFQKNIHNSSQANTNVQHIIKQAKAKFTK